MARIIYSFYIDIPEKELDFFDKNILKEGQTPTNLNTKQKLKENYSKLITCKHWYADQISVPFKMFEYDTNFVLFQKNLQEKYPFITTYNVVNFYKIHLLYELSKQYDEILYLDFDVIPLTTENFFEQWKLEKGIAILHNTKKVKEMKFISKTSQTIRSPTSKYYNAQALLLEKNLSPINNVINTGIIGINKQHLNKLDYFKNFDSEIKMMDKLRNNYDIFPKKIVDFFGFDNETLFSVKINENNVPVQWLDNQWHYFFDKELFIPKETKFVHTINKRFDIVWRTYNA